jgi:hypothetical protein
MTKTQKATKQVQDILKLITTGPRFTAHLNHIIDENGLKRPKNVLNNAFKTFKA